MSNPSTTNLDIIQPSECILDEESIQSISNQSNSTISYKLIARRMLNWAREGIYPGIKSEIVDKLIGDNDIIDLITSKLEKLCNGSSDHNPTNDNMMTLKFKGIDVALDLSKLNIPEFLYSMTTKEISENVIDVLAADQQFKNVYTDTVLDVIDQLNSKTS